MKKLTLMILFILLFVSSGCYVYPGDRGYYGNTYQSRRSSAYTNTDFLLMQRNNIERQKLMNAWENGGYGIKYYGLE